MKQIFNLFGLMMRARKIDYGTNKILDGMRKQQYQLVIIATDTSENTLKRLVNTANNYHVNIEYLGTKETLAAAIGKEIAVTLGVKDIGFSKKLIQLIEKTKSKGEEIDG